MEKGHQPFNSVCFSYDTKVKIYLIKQKTVVTPRQTSEHRKAAALLLTFWLRLKTRSVVRVQKGL